MNSKIKSKQMFCAHFGIFATLKQWTINPHNIPSDRIFFNRPLYRKPTSFSFKFSVKRLQRAVKRTRIHIQFIRPAVEWLTTSTPKTNQLYLWHFQCVQTPQIKKIHSRDRTFKASTQHYGNLTNTQRF